MKNTLFLRGKTPFLTIFGFGHLFLGVKTEKKTPSCFWKIFFRFSGQKTIKTDKVRCKKAKKQLSKAPEQPENQGNRDFS